MKKIMTGLLALAVLLSFAVTALAVEAGGCSVTAGSGSVEPGGTVTIPVTLSGNPGFTNFGIALDYDRTQLELVSIQTADAEQSFLCGAYAAANTGWTDEDGKTYGYITAACPEPVKEDGVLFTATFRASESFSGTASVQPVVRYLRTNQGLLSVFETIPAEAREGVLSTVLVGDFDGNGSVDIFDVTGLYAEIGTGREFTAEELARLDVDGNGSVDVFDVMAIYNIVMNG